MIIVKKENNIEIENIFEDKHNVLLNTLVHMFFNFRKRLKEEKKPNHVGNYCKLFEEQNYKISLDEMEQIKDYSENDYAFIADSNAAAQSEISTTIDYMRYI